jgi:hypothetical protein
MPSSSGTHSPDGSLANAETLGQYLASLRACANQMDLIGRQFCGRAAPSLMGLGTTLVHHVFAVFCGRTSEDMPRIAAAGLVAAMTGEKVLGNRTVSKRVRHPMSVHVRLVGYAKHAIPSRERASGPRPASVWSARRINLRPKPFCGRLADSHSTSSWSVVRGRRGFTARPVPISLAQVA